MALEFVHYLPYITPSVQYTVTRVYTNIPYSDSTSILDTMNSIVKDINLITEYYIQYGITDGSVTDNDGLLSNFVTNFRGVSTTHYTATTIDKLLQDI